MPGPTVVDPRFSARLRGLREQRGLSLRRLARAVPCSHTHVWDLEEGRKSPSPEMASRLDEVLSGGGELAALVIVPAAVDEGRLRYAASNPRRVDRATVATLADLLAGHRRLEDSVGSTPMLPAADAQFAVVEDLAREVRGDLRRHVLAVAAQWAQFTGWLHLSADQTERAGVLLDRALEWATEADDREMLGTSLSFKGHAAWLAGQVGPLIGLSAAVLRDHTVYVGQRAYDQHQLARGYALTGDHQAAKSALAAGADLAAESLAFAGERSPWHYYRDRAFFDLEAGIVHRLLGQDDGHHNDRTITLLTGGLASLPAEMRQADWTAMYLYHLGIAHLQAGDHTSAQTILDQLRAVWAASRSSRAQTYARSLYAALQGR